MFFFFWVARTVFPSLRYVSGTRASFRRVCPSVCKPTSINWSLVLVLASTSWRCVCESASRVRDKSVTMDERFHGVVIGCRNWEGVHGVRRSCETFDFVVGAQTGVGLVSSSENLRWPVAARVLPTTTDTFPGSNCSQSSLPLSAVTKTVSLCRVMLCLPRSFFL